eukprot:TRINITY_DN2498_c0_g2_i1.p1 TRINITY_DN2498_c0_g2~~TRINITY_DN2498_c0_g2_i1.p1  ORF type:complete len:465 (+),score=81.36 TRINITY_DN2498_c0_g2_i1:58-1452(+)
MASKHFFALVAAIFWISCCEGIRESVSHGLEVTECSTSFAEELMRQTSADVSKQFLCKNHLALAYSTQLRNPLWVAFEMDPAEQRLNAGGRRSFRQDPQLPEQSSVQASCFGPLESADSVRVFGKKGVALDRGHLAPSYAFTFDDGAFAETYFMSNVAPQAGKFNRYSWRITEEHLTDYVVATNTKLWVVAGTAYDNIEDPPRIDGTAIPSHFWLAICAPGLGQSAAIWGKNVQENIPAGMDNFIPVSKLLAEPWMKQVLTSGASVFGADVCGEKKAEILDLGHHKEMDKLSDALRVKKPASGETCVPSGNPVVLWRYFEGKGWDKEVSVKNLGNTPVNMAKFSIRLAMNGGDWSKTIVLKNVDEPAGGVYSVAHPKTKMAAFRFGADELSSQLTFNGNDAIGLFECGVLVDVIGLPNSGTKDDIAVGTRSAKDSLLHRDPSVTKGCTEWYKAGCQHQWVADEL